MAEPLALQVPTLSPREAILHAKQLAVEFRDFAEGNPLLDFPPPSRDEFEAYAVLVQLQILTADSYQVTVRGREVFASNEFAFNAVFNVRLKRILLSKASGIVDVVAGWDSIHSGTLSPSVTEVDKRHACEEMVRHKLLKSIIPERGAVAEYEATERFQALLKGKITLREMLK